MRGIWKRIGLIFVALTLWGFSNTYAAETALTFDNYNHEYPEYSPDGNWIVYQKLDATGYYQIYKIPSGGGPETQLTSSPYSHYFPQWSPNSSTIVYSVAWPPDRIATVPAAGGPETYLTGTDQARLYPSFSPDGLTIAYHRFFGGGVAHIMTILATGGSETQLTFGSYYNVGALWSPDGNWIAYRKEEPVASGKQQIYKIPSGGGAEVQLTSDFSNTHDNPQWSHNGNRIGYSRPDTNGYHIYTISSSGGAETALTFDIYGNAFSGWAPNNLYICYAKFISSKWQIYIVCSSGGSQTSVTTDVYHHLYPKFSINGSKLLYQKQDSTAFWQIYVADVPESALIPIVSNLVLVFMSCLLVIALILTIKRRIGHEGVKI